MCLSQLVHILKYLILFDITYPRKMQMLHYYYTTFGDVYAGDEFIEGNFPNLKIIVQRDNVKEYMQLDAQSKTLEKIKELAAVFPSSAFVGSVSQDEIGDRRKKHVADWWEEYDRKVMFIIGAGASSHCVTGSKVQAFVADHLRPPLGNGLFGSNFRSIYEGYEGVRHSLYDLQRENVNVEEYLEEEWKEVLRNGNSEIINRHINIQFYLQEILSKVSQRVIQEYYDANLYAKLASKLQRIYAGNKRTHFAFVSFNQDSILETFLSQYFRRPLNSIDDYAEVNDSPFCVFKPHGSWNWGWQFPNRMKGRSKFLFDNSVSFFKLYFEMLGNHIEMVDWTEWGRELTLNKGKGRLTINKSKLTLQGSDNIGNFYPAILLPYRDKDEFTMPPKHVDRLDQYLSYVETLIIIGWKGNEAMFNQVLNQRATRIKKVIIADPNPDAIVNNLSSVLTRNKIEPIIYKGFDDFIVNGLEGDITL